MLCDVCQNMFSWKESAWPEPADTRILRKITKLFVPIDEAPRTLHGRMGAFHDSGEALRISAESCQICSTVWGLLKDDERAWLGAGPNGQEDAWGELFWRLENVPTSSGLSHILNTGEVGAIIFEFRPLGWEYSMWNKKLELIIQEKAEFFSGKKSPYGFQLNPNVVERSTDSDSAWALASRWLEDCRTTHETCNHPRMPTGWSPTRLLSIRPGLEPNVPFVKLCEANKIPRDAEYMTLSHCWGKLPIAVLTTKNLKDMKNSISWSELPKTFQDAIIITKRLAIEYLWIDSLCIIQDSKGDWDKESMLMQHVYSNSFLNIAATSAPDGRSGCFFDRNTLAIQVCEFDISWEKDQKPKTVIMRAPNDLSGRCNLWLDNFMIEPLNRRAWVVQERVLSPRVLHFTSSQLVWECNERILCEKVPEQNRMGRPTISPLKEADLIGRSTKYKNHNLYYYRVWDEIVWAYSSSGLTNQSDKLVALAGVAQKMKEVMEDTYLWGLWRKKLEHGLIWCVMNPEKATRPHPSVAPSWSWASVNGTVTHPTYRSPSPSFTCIEVIDIDSFGGEIGCSGYNQRGKLQIRCYITTGIFFKSHKLFMVYSGPNEKNERLQFEIWCDVWPEKEEPEYFLVPVMLSPDGMQLYGIMLQKQEEEINFRRAGSFRVGDKYWPSPRMGYFTGSDRDGVNNRGFDIFWKSCYAYGAAHGNGIYNGVFEHKEGHSGGKYTRGDNVIQHTITII